MADVHHAFDSSTLVFSGVQAMWYLKGITVYRQQRHQVLSPFRGEAEPNASFLELASVKGVRSCMPRLTRVHRRFATPIKNAGRVVSSFKYEHASRRAYRIVFSLGTPRFFFALFDSPD